MAIPTQPVTDQEQSASVTAPSSSPSDAVSVSAAPGAAVPSSASSAPVRQPGTRSRAGNAMGRAREAALRGAVLAVAKYGSRKATMGDIAMLAGIAKATLYNHFRTRDDVYRAAVVAEVETIAAAARARSADGLGAMLAEAAQLVAEHPAVRRIAVDEPATLARLATPGASWGPVRTLLAAAVRDAGYPEAPATVEMAVRYFASLLLTPGSAPDRGESARLLAATCGF